MTVDLALVERVTYRLLAVARLEAGIAGFLAGLDAAEKVLKRFVLVDQGLRQAGGHAIGQPWKFTALPFRDQPGQRHVIPRGFVGIGITRHQRRLVGFVVLVPQIQTPVPDEPVIAELHRQLLALGGIGINSAPSLAL